MQVDIGMRLQPSVPLGLVGIQVVQHHVNHAARVVRYDAIHKVQKLTAAAPRVMASLHLAGQDVQGGKKGRVPCRL